MKETTKQSRRNENEKEGQSPIIKNKGPEHYTIKTREKK